MPRLNEPYNDHFLCNLSGGINLWLWPAARHRVLEEWRAPIVAALVRRRIARRPAWQRLFDPKRSYLYGKAVFCPTGILFIRGPWRVPRPSSGSSGTRFGHSPPVFLSQGVGIRLRQNITQNNLGYTTARKYCGVVFDGKVGSIASYLHLIYADNCAGAINHSVCHK